MWPDCSKSIIHSITCFTDLIFKLAFGSYSGPCTACMSFYDLHVTHCWYYTFVLVLLFIAIIPSYFLPLPYSLTSPFRWRQFDNIGDFDDQRPLHFLQIGPDCKRTLVLFLLARDAMLTLISNCLLTSPWHLLAAFRRSLFLEDTVRASNVEVAFWLDRCNLNAIYMIAENVYLFFNIFIYRF